MITVGKIADRIGFDNGDLIYLGNKSGISQSELDEQKGVFFDTNNINRFAIIKDSDNNVQETTGESFINNAKFYTCKNTAGDGLCFRCVTNCDTHCHSCHACFTCVNCTNCDGCDGCDGCVDCNGCLVCNRCANCTVCVRCYGCQRCQSEYSCGSCTSCDGCDGCNGCQSEVNCESRRSGETCSGSCHGCTGNYSGGGCSSPRCASCNGCNGACANCTNCNGVCASCLENCYTPY